MPPPRRAPSWSSQAFMARYTVPLRPNAIPAWMMPPWPWLQNGYEARAGEASSMFQVWPPSVERRMWQRRDR